MFDYKATKEGLDILYNSIKSLNGKYNDQIRKYIDVGEYPLALDGIADAYTSSKASMPLALFQLFDKLATDMDLASDPEFSAVAEFQKAQATSA